MHLPSLKWAALSALLSLPLAAQVVPFFTPVVMRSQVRGTELARLVDLNNDQHLDLVFYHDYTTDRAIDFQLNQGNNTFGPQVSVDANFYDVRTLELADLNGDQLPDLVAGSGDSNYGIRVYRNTGSGFTLSQTLSDYNTYSLALADLDGDGDKDLVYGYQKVNTYALKWRPNDGSGQFGSERTITSLLSTKVYTADVDRDGDQDVIAFHYNNNSVAWYPNNGSGTFGSARTIDSNLSSQVSSDARDADDDGDIDLVAMAGGNVYLYRNNGSGTFTRSTAFSTFGTQDSIKFIRADGDAQLDLVYEANSSLFYRRNQGNGTFGSEQYFPKPNTSWSTKELLAVDFDKDGREDLVSTEWGQDNLWFHRNGTGLPPNLVSFAAADNTVNAGATATLNWNVEGATTIRIDGNVVTGSSLVVTPGQYDKTYTLTAANAAGSVTAKATVFIPDTVFSDQITLFTQTTPTGIEDIDVGDINGDGKPDIAYVIPSWGQIGWYAAAPGAGLSYGDRQLITQSADDPGAVLLVDIDKDGDKDLVAGIDSGAQLYKNNGKGQFAAPVLINNLRTTGFKEVDLNRDGWPDLLLMSRSVQPIRAVMNNGSGGLLPAITVADGGGYDAVVTDVDKDGFLDLLATSEYSSRMHRGTGPLSFGPAEVLAADAKQSSLYYGDINGDGLGDVLFQGGSSGRDNVGIALGRPGGTFQTTAFMRVSNLSDFVGADFDGDSDVDVAFVTSSSTPPTVGWMESDGLGKFSEVFPASTTAAYSYKILARDMDGDKDLDLVGHSTNRVFWLRNVTEHATLPAIDKFESKYPVIHRGESVDLSWAVTGDRYLSVSISGIGVVSGTGTTVTPTETTTYILSATNRGGTITKEITVTVVDRPVIYSFTTDKNDVDRTTKVNLSWLAAGADQLSISPTIGTVTGTTVPATLYKTTTFLLTATNEHGSDTKELTVNVNPALFRFAATLPGPNGMSAPTVMQTADFDLDGRPDIAAAARSGSGTNDGRIYWIRSTGNGTFTPAQVIQSNNSSGANDITVGDLNGDGRPDFASVSGSISSDTSGSIVQWFKSLPNGTWETMPLETAGATTLGVIHAVDWDLDGDLDLVASAGSRMNSVIWFKNLGGGNFAPRAELGGNFDQVRRITSADLDGDHDPDLVLSRSGSAGDLFVLTNAGDGTIGEQRVLLARSDVRFFDLGDLDGDKDIDIVATSADQFRCERFLNDGTGHFGEGLRLIPTQQIGAGMSLGDVDSDGDLDVVWLNGTFKWSENLGDGSFRNEEPSPTLQRALAGSPLLADFDGDGDLDAFGKADTNNMQQDWFENLSTPPSEPPVIAEFSATDAVILPGKRLDLHWSVTGFPISLEIVPAVQTTALPLTQRGATVTSVATETETVQSYTLIVRNIRGETRRELSFRVGNPPDIRSFTHAPALVNEGKTVTLAWDIARADQLVIDGTVDVSGESGIGFVPHTAPFTTYQIVATNIFGSSTASTTVEVNRNPVATPLPPFTANAAGAAMEVETAAAFTDPDENDHFTWSITGNTLPGLFSAIAIDPATGKLTASFTEYIDGESLLTIRGTDRNGLYAESTLLVTLPRVPDPALQFSGEVTVNRQSGLFEQSLKITNSGARAIGGFRIEIRGLPDGFSVRGAETPAAGEPWVLVFHQPVVAGATVEVKIEYFSTQRGGGLSPQISVIQIARPGAVAAPVGRMFQIDRMVRLEDGSILLEWDATPGRRYGVEYASGDTMDWKRSPVIVTAATNRVQWIDQGPPKTESQPSTVAMRLYRVLELDEP